MATPAVRWKSSIDRCNELPAPGEEKSTFPGSRLAALMNSLMFFAGFFGCTTSRTAMSASNDTGANESASNGTFE